MPDPDVSGPVRAQRVPARRPGRSRSRRRPDITRARQRLGWEPRIALHDGLIRTIDDFRGRA